MISLGRHDRTQPVTKVSIATPRGECSVRLDLARASQRYMHDVIAALGTYEAEVMREIFTLQPGEVLFDVGAHCGLFSALAKHMGAAVWAFEPHPENFADLQNNCPGCHLVNWAVGETDGRAALYWNRDNDGGHALWDPGAHPWNHLTRAIAGDRKAITVEQTHLNHYSKFKPALIKIDTEGAELLVLRGATEVLVQPQLRAVICELNEFGLAQLGHDEGMLREHMNGFGFTAPEAPTDGGVGNLIFKR